MDRIGRIREGDDLESLTARLYNVADDASGMKAAADGLVRANRHLTLRKRGRDKSLEGGAFVVVPEVEGANHTNAALPLPQAVAGILLERARKGLDQVLPRLEESRREARLDLERMIELTQADEVRHAAREDRELAGRLEAIRERAKERLAEASEAAEHRRSAVERAAETLSELMERAARG